MIIDPGALGALLIGLRATRERPDLDGPPNVQARAPSPTRRSFVQAAVSRTMRPTSHRGQSVEAAPVAAGCGD